MLVTHSIEEAVFLGPPRRRDDAAAGPRGRDRRQPLDGQAPATATARSSTSAACSCAERSPRRARCTRPRRAVRRCEASARAQGRSATSGALAVLLLAWAALAAAVDSPALPGPVIAIQTFVTQWPEIWPEIVVSFWRVMAAMALGTALAVPLGLVARAFATGRRLRRADDLPAVSDSEGRLPAGAARAPRSGARAQGRAHRHHRLLPDTRDGARRGQGRARAERALGALAGRVAARHLPPRGRPGGAARHLHGASHRHRDGGRRAVPRRVDRRARAASAGTSSMRGGRSTTRRCSPGSSAWRCSAWCSTRRSTRSRAGRRGGGAQGGRSSAARQNEGVSARCG